MVLGKIGRFLLSFISGLTKNCVYQTKIKHFSWGRGLQFGLEYRILCDFGASASFGMSPVIV